MVGDGKPLKTGEEVQSFGGHPTPQLPEPIDLDMLLSAPLDRAVTASSIAILLVKVNQIIEYLREEEAK